MALHCNAALSINDSSINHRRVCRCLLNPNKMKLKLTKDTQADLEDIRELIEKKNYSEFRGDRNRLKLSEVYREVMAFSGFKVNGINATCDSCINDAVNTVYNFVTYHEQKPGEKDAVIVEFAGGKPKDKLKDKMLREHGYDVSLLEDFDESSIKKLPEEMDYKELLALAKEKGYKGGRIPKKDLIDFLTKTGE